MHSRKLNVENSLYQLTPLKVHNILLVATWYENFILEKDGHLLAQIQEELLEMNISDLPHIIRASASDEALQQLDSRNFDLVITMSNLADTTASDFAQKVKSKYEKLPIVLLLTDPSYLKRDFSSMNLWDGVFFWSGDPSLLIAIIKIVEDRRNVVHDIQTELVKVILVVDDSIQYYSKLLPIVYTEVLHQTQMLSHDSLNHRQRLAYMRTRPKILLASDYESALKIASDYEGALLGLLTDVAFPQNKKLTEDAGIQLVKKLREKNGDLPVILMSSDDYNAVHAQKLGISYVNKNSPSFGNLLKNFIVSNMGFGDFVFRNPENMSEIARADSLREFQMVLPQIDPKSLFYHCSHNHISTWLMSHGKYDLALSLRPKKIEEFHTSEALQQFLIKSFENYREFKQIGQIVRYKYGDWDSDFIVIGNGSVGGKARGIAFVNYILANYKVMEAFPNVKIKIPKSISITAEEFDSFLANNSLNEKILSFQEDGQIKEAFLSAKLSDLLLQGLTDFLRGFRRPIAVRPSSLMEDYEYLPFAGISSFLLPNTHPDDTVRLQQLTHAIKLLYASVFSQSNRSYLGQKIQEVKMGVVVQELVGQPYEHYVFPSFSGIAQSWNEHPFCYTMENGQQRTTAKRDGIAKIAMGIGRLVMEQGRALQFCPNCPESFRYTRSAVDFWHSAQTYFYAFDVRVHSPNLLETTANLTKLDIRRAPPHLIQKLCAYYSRRTSHMIQQDLSGHGICVATFANVLQENTFPLCSLLQYLLQLLRNVMAKEIEIEFAINLPESAQELPTFYILQIRPLVGQWIQ